MRWLLLCVVANALTPKLCIHCKHFKPNNLSGPEFGRCGALPNPHSNSLYFVTGKIDLKDWYCFTARSSDTLCGNSGKLFEKLDTLDRLH
jgi:hypothetical protein